MKANKISGRCHSQHLLIHIPISIKYSNFHHIFLKGKINKRNVDLYIAIISFAFSLNICRHIKLCTYTYVSLIKISHPKIIACTKVLMSSWEPFLTQVESKFFYYYISFSKIKLSLFKTAQLHIPKCFFLNMCAFAC